MYTSLVARRSALQFVVAFTLCVSLLLIQNISLVINTASAQGQNAGSKREERPSPGKPEGSFPDLEEVQNESHIEREPAPPIPSTIRSPRSRFSRGTGDESATPAHVASWAR